MSHEHASSPLALSSVDVQRLLSQPSVDSRLDVVQKIASGYHAGGFSENESLIAEQIFRHLTKDGEVKVRRAVSELLQGSPVPRDIALTLARDVEDAVALPVLKHSTSLSEYDLVNIIETAVDVSRMLAVAQRPSISERVSTALVDTGRETVTNTLLQNDSARISENSYRSIIEKFSTEAGVMQNLAARQNLPVTVAESLVTFVSDTIAQQLREQYNLNGDEASRQTQSVREQATLRLLDQNETLEAQAALVEQIASNDRLTPTLILSALCRGNLLFFEMALARLVGIPLSNAQILIHDEGGLGFKRLYEKTGLPESLFAATRMTLSVVSHLEQDPELVAGTPHYANRAVMELLARAEGRDVDNISYMVALIRQNGRLN